MRVHELTLTTALSLGAIGVVAGVCNAIAGGGTLFSFPVFMAAGLPPVVANASNAVAVWPGHALASLGYRKELQQVSGGLAAAGLAAVIGGATGAYLLSLVGNSAFLKLIPYLLLAATMVFAVGPAANRWLSHKVHVSAVRASFGPVGLFGILLFSIYGGFFGAGLGVMLMAGLLLLGVQDPQQNNALKNALATVVTSVAVAIFAFSGLVAWSQTACAFVGAIIGGLLGSRLARLMSPRLLRLCVIAFGLGLSACYFLKYAAAK
jgi:uncharacterized protein